MDLQIRNILLEEEEDDDILLYCFVKNERGPIHPMFQRRSEEGHFNLLIRQHLMSDDGTFKQYCRLDKQQFYFVLSLIENDLTVNTHRKVISKAEKLFVTLRYLATGESFVSLSFAYRISNNHISRIVRNVLKVLSKQLLPRFMPAPDTNDFKRIAEHFYNQWNIPNCIGAIDGKHVRLRCPSNSGSLYFNYKDYFSIVLLAVVDANCKFIMVDVGAYGKEGDSNIFKNSAIGKQMESNTFNIPEEKCLPNSNVFVPHFLIGDEAFGIDSYMMRPYTRKATNNDKKKAIFNYRLCRARRVSENAFGLLSQVFRVFYTPIAVHPDTCTDLVLTACCLHNLLRNEYLEHQPRASCQNDASQNLPTLNMEPLKRSGGYAKRIGLYVREQLAEYFSSAEGQVSWQEDMIRKVN